MTCHVMIMKVLWYDYEGVSLMHTPSSKVLPQIWKILDALWGL